MSVWGAITWNVARGGGFTAYILLAISVALGLALTSQMQAPRWPRIINSELHNFVTLLALVFTFVHVAAVWLDPFTRFGWNEVFIPLASHYRPLWIALGIVALYLGIAIALSTLLRPYIGYTWWRRLHVLTLVVYALVTVHGIATGSDSATWWGIVIYGGSVLLVGSLLSARLLSPTGARGKAHPVIAAAVAVLVLFGVAWTVAGPLQPGWNAIANNGNGSGSRDALAAPQKSVNSKAASESDPFAAPFTSSVSGMMTQRGPDPSGNVTLDFQASLAGQTPASIRVVLQGQQSPADGSIAITSTAVTLSTISGSHVYQGQLSRLSDFNEWRMAAVLSGSGPNPTQIEIRASFSVTDSGQLTGALSGTPISTSPPTSPTGGVNA